MFYQGNYSTSRDTLLPEAFSAFSAYRFQIPEKYQNFTVYKATVSMTYTGTIFCYGHPAVRQSLPERLPVFTKDAATWLLNDNSNWRQYTQIRTGFFQSLNNSVSAMTNGCSEILYLDNTKTQGVLNLGGINSAKPYWIDWPGGQVTYADGCIPKSNTPWRVSFELGQTFKDSIASLRDGWMPCMYSIAVTGGNTDIYGQDYPYWYNGDSKAAGFWLSFNVYGFTLELTMQLGEA